MTCRWPPTSLVTPSLVSVDGGPGLCAACYQVHYLAGTLNQFPRRTRPYEQTYALWLDMREQGLTHQEAADRLGISFKLFQRIRRNFERQEQGLPHGRI